MIDCPACGVSHKPGALFCRNCGEYLGVVKPVTSELSPREGGARSLEDVVDETASMPSGGALGDMLDIEVVASGRRVQWIGISELLIGRADLACGVDPDLDLEPDGGLKGGVSRRHCRVYRQQGVYLVEDVGSANGTYLNGERLSAYLPRILKHHDELQLGGMLLRVTIDEGAARM